MASHHLPRMRMGMVDQNQLTPDFLLEQADAIFQERNYNEALTRYAEAVEAAQADFNRPVEVEALAQVARVNLILGNKEEGRKWLDEAASRATDSSANSPTMRPSSTPTSVGLPKLMKNAAKIAIAKIKLVTGPAATINARFHKAAL